MPDITDKYVNLLSAMRDSNLEFEIRREVVHYSPESCYQLAVSEGFDDEWAKQFVYTVACFHLPEEKRRHYLTEYGFDIPAEIMDDVDLTWPGPCHCNYHKGRVPDPRPKAEAMLKELLSMTS